MELSLDRAFSHIHRNDRPLVRRPIGDVCDVVTGTSINANEKALRYEGLLDGLPYIATKDVDLQTGRIAYENGVRIPLGEPGFRVAPAGTVFVCAEGGSAGRKVGLTDRPVCFGNKLLAVIPSADLLSTYVLNVVKSRDFYDQFSDLMSGIIGGVSLKRFREIAIPVPTLSEQEESVRALLMIDRELSELEKSRQSEADARARLVDAAIRELRQATTPGELRALWREIRRQFDRWFLDASACKRLRQAVIDIAVSGSLATHEQYAATTLGELCAFGPKNGFSPKPVEGPTDTKTMSLAAITKGSFEPNAYKYVRDRPEPESDLWVRPGDLLIQRANTIEYVGVSAIYTGGINEFIYPDLIMRVTPKGDVDSKYLHLALSSSAARDFMRARASGTSGTMPKINQATVRSVPVHVPTLGHQRAMVELVEEVLTVVDRLEKAIVSHDESGLAFLRSCTGTLDDSDPGGGNPRIDETEGAVNVEVQEAGRTVGTLPQALGSKLQHDDDRAFEAVLVSAVVEEFFARSGEPLGNFRLQKAVYFARRRLNDARVDLDYLRMAAGPYNPRMRYSGGIAVAKSQGWIREARGRFGFGHIRGSNADYAHVTPRLKEVATWVRDTFVLRKNEEWECLATVDYAARALQRDGAPATPKAVLSYIRDLDVWRHKIAKLGLTEHRVESAMLELHCLFAEGPEASVRAGL